LCLELRPITFVFADDASVPQRPAEKIVAGRDQVRYFSSVIGANVYIDRMVGEVGTMRLVDIEKVDVLNAGNRPYDRTNSDERLRVVIRADLAAKARDPTLSRSAWPRPKIPERGRHLALF